MQQRDWNTLYESGFRWMYPKKVDGKSGPDSYFARSKILAKAAGFIVFAGYCFFRFDQEPLEQARALCAGGIAPGEGPFVLDCEWDNASHTLAYHDKDHGGTKQMIDIAGEERLYTCLCEIESLSGVTPWLYGSYGFLRFLKPDRFARFPFVVANYSTRTGDDKVPLPAPWTREVARQYSGSLRAGGAVEIDGDRFLGSLEQLKGYVKV
jgi:GH25 family lysozyme M1 (1,4-beta-N-acetylmuramidase)